MHFECHGLHIWDNRGGSGGRVDLASIIVFAHWRHGKTLLLLSLSLSSSNDSSGNNYLARCPVDPNPTHAHTFPSLLCMYCAGKLIDKQGKTELFLRLFFCFLPYNLVYILWVALHVSTAH